MKVPLLDLTAQYGSIRAEIREAMDRVVESQGFILGPEVDAFESAMAEYVGAPHAIGVASGTDALLLPLRALEPRAGDEVILPAFTFFATAGAAWNAGFTPVFCDVDPDSFNVTVETLDAVWSPRTRAAIPVHLFGQMAPMEEIVDWAEERGVVLLEDAAQAIGARRALDGADGAGRMAGAWAPVSAFSFFPTKNLGGFGDAGLVTALDDELAERVRKLRVHGGRQMYHHEMVGTNSRLDALQAAILATKLPHLDRWAARRRENACRYEGILSDVPEVMAPKVLPGNYHVYNQFTLRVRRRDELRGFLSERGIGTGIYYPVPLHLQECFASLGGRVGNLPVSETLAEQVLSLPIFPELEDAAIDFVGGSIRDFYGL
ncbi:MAG: DegT/DnrJ/EryC1/StrS family aminotransferase [Gemmatimonadales bacterium]|jgi:dTDP-4-amino-4,6-dideoxygalactose transaminase|nr:MAG: DegT/DnrJ/EryC1/StrS family aminotransferase [Gemmatimonadales bacterium]